MKKTNTLLIAIAIMMSTFGILTITNGNFNSTNVVSAVDDEEDDDDDDDNVSIPAVVVPAPSPNPGVVNNPPSTAISTPTVSTPSTATASNTKVESLTVLATTQDYKNLATLKMNEIINSRAEIAKNRTARPITGEKLGICNQRFNLINNTMIRMTDRAIKHILWLDDIVNQIQAFVTANNLSIDSYASLMSSVSSSRADAEGAVSATTGYAQKFKCDASDAIGITQDFKAGFRAEIQTINSYKTAVKNLVSAVKAKV